MTVLRSIKQCCPAHDSPRMEGLDVWFWCLLGAALALRIPGLASSELWWDEFLVINRAELPLGMLWDSLKFQSASEAYADASPPLHHILAHYSLMLGHNEFFAKLPSVVFGSFSVGMAYLAGRDLFGKGAGLASGTILCLSTFHVSFSRDMRWYAVFMFFCFMTLWAAKGFSCSCGKRQRLALIVGLCGMLYSSYVATPFVFGVFIYIFSTSFLNYYSERSRESKIFIISNFSVLFVVILAYLPQLEGHFTASKLFQMQFGNYFDFSKIALSVQHFTHGLSPVPDSHLAAVVVLCCGAMLWSCFSRNLSSLFLLLVFTIPQVAAAFLIFIQAPVQTKYLVGLLVLFVLLAGVGAQAVSSAVSWLVRVIFGIALHRFFRIALGAGALMILLLDVPFFSSFGDGMKPTTKLVARHLALARDNCDYLMYARNRQDKVIYGWYLGEQFKNFSTFQAGPYRRFLFVGVPDTLNSFEMPLQKNFDLRGETVQVRRGGIVSIAPVALVPNPDNNVLFEERFDSLSYYRTVWRSRNMGIDSQHGTLSLFGFSEPGHSLYRFKSGRSGFSESIRLTLGVRMEKAAQLPADATLTLSAGPDEHAAQVIAVLNHAALNERLVSRGGQPSSGLLVDTLSFDLPRESMASDNLYLKFSLTPGKYQSSIEIDWFRLETIRPVHEVADDPVWTQLENVCSNVRVAQWSPERALVDSDELYVFSAFGAGGHTMQGGAYLGKDQLQAFKDENPGLPPVLTLYFRDGSTAFQVYDPGLLAGGLSVQRDKSVHVLTGADLPMRVRSVSFVGRLDRTQMDIGGQKFVVPFVVPSRSFVAVNLGGKGLMRFESVFETDALDTRDFIPPTNVVKLAGQECVSCQDEKPCAVSYRIASELPITSLRMVYYPRGSVAGDNWVKVSYALDGFGALTTFDTYVPRGKQPWVGDMDGRQLRLSFPKPTYIVDLRFDISGDGMQLWSSSGYPMFFEADVDASSFKEFSIEERSFQVSAQGGGEDPFRMWWSPAPVDFFPRWAR